MADAKEKAPKAAKGPQGAPKGGGKGKEKGGAGGAAVDHEPKAREGAPRLQTFYQQTVLNAFRETNDALTGSQKRQQEFDVQRERVVALREFARLRLDARPKIAPLRLPSK